MPDGLKTLAGSARVVGSCGTIFGKTQPLRGGRCDRRTRIGGKMSELRASLNIELTENAVHVILHGRNADTALISNLLVGTTDGEQAADLALAKRQGRIGFTDGTVRRIGGRTCRYSPGIGETHRNVHLFQRRARTHEDCAATALEP